MADPIGREVDRVSVRVLPNTKRFLADLQQFLQRIERQVRVEIPTSLDTSGLVAEARAAASAIDAALGEVAVEAVAETAVAEAELNAVARDRTSTINVDVDQSALESVASALGPVSSSFGRGGFGGMGHTKMLLLAAAAALPVILTAIQAIPATLAGIGAPIAAIVAGLDGIKAAFEDSSLAGMVQEIQTAVSGEFMRGLTPVFDDLLPVMLVVERGLAGIAASLSAMAGFSVDQFVSTDGLAMIEEMFANIRGALDVIGPAMGPFMDTIVRLAESGTQAFLEISPAIAEVIEEFNRMIVWLDENGLLTDAIKGFLLLILGLVTVFGYLTFGALAFIGVLQRMADTIRPFLELLEDVLGDIITMADDFARLMADSMYEAGVQLMKKLGDGIAAGYAEYVVGEMFDIAESIAGFVPGSPVKEGPLTSFNNGRAGAKLIDMLAGGMDSRLGQVKRVAGRAADILANDTLAVAGAGSRSGLTFEIGEVRAHDYQDFMQQMQRRSGMATSDGVRMP